MGRYGQVLEGVTAQDRAWDIFEVTAQIYHESSSSYHKNILQCHRLYHHSLLGQSKFMYSSNNARNDVCPTHCVISIQFSFPLLSCIFNDNGTILLLVCFRTSSRFPLTAQPFLLDFWIATRLFLGYLARYGSRVVVFFHSDIHSHRVYSVEWHDYHFNPDS